MNEPKKFVPHTPPLRMNIIGSGKLGRTLARLLRDAGLVSIGSIYNRNIDSSESAQAFIGAGRAVNSIQGLSNDPAELWMLATSDDAIGCCAAQLAELSGIDWQKGIIRIGLSKKKWTCR